LQLVALGGGAPVLGRLKGVDGGEPETAEDRGVADGPGWWHGTASWTTGGGMAPLPCAACVRLPKIAHKPAEQRTGPDAGICSPLLMGEIASAALSDRWVPWEVGDGSLRWTAGAPIGRPVGGRAGGGGGGVARRRRRLRDEVPSRSMHDPTAVFAGALLWTGWRAVTVGGIH